MYVDTPETAFLHDLTKPSLEALSYILRHKERWPEGFKWNYGSCADCGMGLADRLWEAVRSPCTYHMADILNMSGMAAREIFAAEGDWLPRHPCGIAKYSEVTPEMVAEQIDKYIAERG